MAEFKPQKTFTSRRQWRTWLAEHYGKSGGIWMVRYRKDAGKGTISYEDAVEEALCFGWVDSQVHKLDEDKFVQRFTPRKKKSTWSQSNKDRVERLMEMGCMTEAGLAKIRAAKADGSWQSLNDVDNLVVPDDLAAALAANAEAGKNFRRMPPSHRKEYIYWIATAKRDETRKRRIAETLKRLSRDEKRIG